MYCQCCWAHALHHARSIQLEGYWLSASRLLLNYASQCIEDIPLERWDNPEVWDWRSTHLCQHSSWIHPYIIHLWAHVIHPCKIGNLSKSTVLVSWISHVNWALKITHRELQCAGSVILFVNGCFAKRRFELRAVSLRKVASHDECRALRAECSAKGQPCFLALARSFHAREKVHVTYTCVHSLETSFLCAVVHQIYCPRMSLSLNVVIYVPLKNICIFKKWCWNISRKWSKVKTRIVALHQYTEGSLHQQLQTADWDEYSSCSTPSQ